MRSPAKHFQMNGQFDARKNEIKMKFNLFLHSNERPNSVMEM